MYYCRYFELAAGVEHLDAPILNPRGDLGYMGFNTFVTAKRAHRPHLPLLRRHHHHPTPPMSHSNQRSTRAGCGADPGQDLGPAGPGRRRSPFPRYARLRTTASRYP
jgi:hypothetical protein